MAFQGHASRNQWTCRMKITFRADASLQIGSGHVMRCLTLADAFVGTGADCQFICRAHEGHLIDFIRSKGYVTHILPSASAETCVDAVLDGLTHRDWLGGTQQQDAAACIPILQAQRPDWLIADHYALDAHWENVLAPYCHRLMVIDDLADRQHNCNLLLDQTFGRIDTDYLSLVSTSCQLLCGSQYALLRPEFAALRSCSLQRRAQPVLRKLLITMGGVDKDNATGKTLHALHSCPLPADCQVTVVMGATAPWLKEVQAQAQGMPWSTRVLVDVRDMAQLMADSDLAIGAAGATSWERCCLGLPTIILVLAKNQYKIAQELSTIRATQLIEFSELKDKLSRVTHRIIHHELASMSSASAKITDGLGVSKVINAVLRLL